MNPLTLAVRFLLELFALWALGAWGWHQRDDGFRIVVALALPLLAAAIWGTFAVPNDPSRSGSAPIPVPGTVRLALELAFFASAAYAFYRLGRSTTSLGFAAAVALHYVLSADRLRWLLAR